MNQVRGGRGEGGRKKEVNGEGFERSGKEEVRVESLNVEVGK